MSQGQQIFECNAREHCNSLLPAVVVLITSDRHAKPSVHPEAEDIDGLGIVGKQYPVRVQALRRRPDVSTAHLQVWKWPEDAQIDHPAGAIKSHVHGLILLFDPLKTWVGTDSPRLSEHRPKLPAGHVEPDRQGPDKRLNVERHLRYSVTVIRPPPPHHPPPSSSPSHPNPATGPVSL
jgi:hypothetical protein